MAKGKFGKSLTPPILGGLVGVKSKDTYTEGGKKGYGDSKTKAKADYHKKNKK